MLDSWKELGVWVSVLATIAFCVTVIASCEKVKVEADSRVVAAKALSEYSRCAPHGDSRDL